MASQEDLVNRIRLLISGFDEAGWEALANKGLARRARKDLEKGLGIEFGEPAVDSLAIHVPPFDVTIPPSGPAKARCTCPSPGVCQHILAACFWLHSAAQPTEAEPCGPAASPRDEVAAISREQIRKWAGASDFRGALALLDGTFDAPAIEEGEIITVRFQFSGIEARFVPGGGLDGMVVPSLHGKRIAAAALLALHRHFGVESRDLEEQTSFIDFSGAPRSRDEVLSAAATLMENTITIGLSHLSPFMADRFVTLSVSAMGVELPRLSLALKGLADEIRAILNRQGSADESRLLLAMARVYALVAALRSAGMNPSPDLIGTARAKYLELSEVELQGVGAYPWQTASGYRGLTVFFWNNSSREFLSWSEARPSLHFDPVARFTSEGPWQGAQTPKQAASSRLMLRHGRRSAQGRLSSSTRSSALVLGLTEPSSLDFGDRLFQTWGPLRAYGVSEEPIGLREANPLQRVAVLVPSAYGRRLFDPTSQTFCWEVLDESGAALVLSLQFTEWSSAAIQTLEALKPPEQSVSPQSWKFVVRLSLRDAALVVEPISILRPDAPDAPVFHLAFDPVPKKTTVPEASSARATEVTDEDEADEEYVEDDPCIGGTLFAQAALTEINRRLTSIAEAGCQGEVRAHSAWFAGARRELHSSGLTCMAEGLDGLQHSVSAAAVLRARYLSHLHLHIAAGKVNP